MSAFPWTDFVVGVVILAVSPLLLGAYGGHVAAETISDKARRQTTKFIFWSLAALGIICACIFQYRAIRTDHAHAAETKVSNDKWDKYHQEDLTAIETISRPGGSTPQNLANAWGAVSIAEKPQSRIQPSRDAVPPPQAGHRVINAEELGRAVKASGGSGIATIINDGTVEAGSFAKQLEIGLRMAGWQVGGDNIKMGDPDFFPDSLTVEVSSNPVSLEDHSIAEAKNLIRLLKRENVTSTLRFTTLAFPANFMRIKVAGQ